VRVATLPTTVLFELTMVVIVCGKITIGGSELSIVFIELFTYADNLFECIMYSI
jgi:hypothetical protein